MYIKFAVPIEYKLFGHKQIEKKKFVAYFDPIDDEPDLKEGIIIDSENIKPNLREFIDTCLVKKNRSDLLNKDYQLIISFFEDEDNNKGGYLLEYITEKQEVIFDIEIEIDKNNAFFMPDNNVSIPYSNNNSITNSNITGGFMNFNNNTNDKVSDKEKGVHYSGKMQNDININDVSNNDNDTNNFENWNKINKTNIKKMNNIWGNLSKNNIKIVGNGVNNYATEHKAILEDVQIMITNSLSKNDKSFIQKVIPGIMRVLTNIKDSSSESLNNIFEKITKGYSISELEKIISFLEKFLSTFGYNLPQRRSISSYTKNKTGGSNESINTNAVKYVGLFSILLGFLYFLYQKIEEYPYINPINKKYDPYRFPKSNNERGITKKNKNGSKKNGKVHFNNSKSKLVNQKISVNRINFYEKENPKGWSNINHQKARTSYQKFYNNNTGKNITFTENTKNNLKFLKNMQKNYNYRGLQNRLKNFSKKRKPSQLIKSSAAKAHKNTKQYIENILKKFRNDPEKL